MVPTGADRSQLVRVQHQLSPGSARQAGSDPLFPMSLPSSLLPSACSVPARRLLPDSSAAPQSSALKSAVHAKVCPVPRGLALSPTQSALSRMHFPISLLSDLRSHHTGALAEPALLPCVRKASWVYAQGRRGVWG